MDFISSSSFQGVKFGYIYKNGSNGIGYYIDKKSTNDNFYEVNKISSRHVDHINSNTNSRSRSIKDNDNYFKYQCKKIRSYIFNKDNDKDIQRYLWSPVLIVSNTYIFHIYLLLLFHSLANLQYLQYYHLHHHQYICIINIIIIITSISY